MEGFKKHTWVVVLLILVALAARFLPLAPNFTPILAIAFFAGSRISKTWVAYAIPFTALLLSDVVLGMYPGMALVYIPFLIMVALGAKVAQKGVGAHFLAGSMGAVIFFLISNFGVWAYTGMYPKTLEGLMACYAMGLPFFKNTFASLWFFSGLLFMANASYVRLGRPSLAR